MMTMIGRALLSAAIAAAALAASPPAAGRTAEGNPDCVTLYYTVPGLTLAGLSAETRLRESDILSATLECSRRHRWPGRLAAYVDAGDWNAPLPVHTGVWLEPYA